MVELETKTEFEIKNSKDTPTYELAKSKRWVSLESHEAAMKEERMIIKCVLCGEEKIYKTKNKRRCPCRTTHKWRVQRKAL